MATLYVMVGLPASGKSYWAREKAKPYDVIVSSDSIREELYGDASIQDDPGRVFNIMFQRTRAALHAGRTTFYDATNINAKRRINFLKSLKKLFPDLHCICVVVATPIDVCQERNSERERVVPTYVIDRMLRQFEVPCKAEGWDEILVVHYESKNTLDGGIDSYRYEYGKIVSEYGEQGNSHHTLSLGEHCTKCCRLAREYYKENNLPINSDLVYAALFHDYGKVWTAIYWEKDDYKELHYPNHANVSSYMALTMGYNLHIAQLAGLHMIPYTDEKCQAAWRARMGEELWEEVQLLHKFDTAAH